MYRELVIVGAGPAGLAAALEARELGVKDILLLERAEHLGGILMQCIHTGFGLEEFGEELSGPEYALRFADRITQTHIEVRLGTMVTQITPNRDVYSSSQRGFEKIEAGAILLAMGCRERTAGMIGLMGERPAGVYMAGAAQGMINLEGKKLGSRALIYGSGDIGLIMARRLLWEGVALEGVVEVMPRSSGLARNVRQCLEDYHIPLYLNSQITRVIGRDHIEAVDVFHHDSGESRRIPIDLLLLSVGLIPENDLVSAFLDMDPRSSGPLCDAHRACSIEGFYACGNTLHVHDIVDFVSEEGRLAARGAAHWLKGGKRGASSVIEASGNIHSFVPQVLRSEDPFDLYLRVKEPLEKGKLKIYNGEHILLEKTLRFATPSQMVKIMVPRRENRDKLRLEIV